MSASPHAGPVRAWAGGFSAHAAKGKIVIGKMALVPHSAHALPHQGPSDSSLGCLGTSERLGRTFSSSSSSLAQEAKALWKFPGWSSARGKVRVPAWACSSCQTKRSLCSSEGRGLGGERRRGSRGSLSFLDLTRFSHSLVLLLPGYVQSRLSSSFTGRDKGSGHG